ncbi:hypothetical protein TorRG33x02_137870 [Trema orientale]|uniref:Uncharacterized protein n=1 Tax=Trema orientale TaxID=63057 RepID=A0A2P5EY91_TREOI|nr:hypothetical protein TorRG33x02_137870 [Trema orientale]
MGGCVQNSNSKAGGVKTRGLPKRNA